MDTALLRDLIENKKVLILGFGKEGQSSYRFLRKHFAEKLFYIADKDSGLREKFSFAQHEKIEFVLGDAYMDSLDEFDLIIKTPGISLKNLDEQLLAKIHITSQTDLFLHIYSAQIVGITGTKGKSTTTNLIYHILKLHHDNVVLVGNMGFPPFDQAEMIDDNTFIVFEMSSHQLENCTKAPHYAVLLNLFQEHLDHYQSYMDYQLAKFNIAKYQTADDYFICNADNAEINSILKDIKFDSILLQFSLEKEVSRGCFFRDNMIFYCDGKTSTPFYDCSLPRYLKGEHNLLNIMAAVNVCKVIGIPDDVIHEGIAGFKGLEHRLEFAGSYNDIEYYNDSISTIPEATIAAVKALKNVNTLLLGGFDRGIDYSKLAVFLVNSDVEHLIFIGDAGNRILAEIEMLGKHKNKCFKAQNFENAIEMAKEKTKKSCICLLSPAAASYDMFKNFEERGKVFKKLIQ